MYVNLTASHTSNNYEGKAESYYEGDRYDF